MAAGITKNIIGTVAIVERYELTANDDILNITGATITLTVPGDIFTNEGDDVVKVTNTTITGAAGTSFFLGSGNDRFELSNSTLSLAILAGSGNDYILITGTAQSVVTLNAPSGGATALSFGDGDDTLEVASILSGDGSIDFVSGNDTLLLNGGKLLLTGAISNLRNFNVSSMGGTLGRNLALVGTTTSITLNGNLTGTDSSRGISVSNGVTTFTTGNNVSTNVAFSINDSTFNHVAGGTLEVSGILLKIGVNAGYAFSAFGSIVTLHDLVLTNNGNGGIYGNNTAWNISNSNFSNSKYGTNLTGGSIDLQNVNFSSHTVNAVNLKGSTLTGNDISFSGNKNVYAFSGYGSTLSQTAIGTVYVDSSTTNLTSASFNNNYTSVSANLTNNSSSPYASMSAHGGAIYAVGGFTTIAKTTFSVNYAYALSSVSSGYGGGYANADAWGGAICAIKGDITVADTMFSGNYTNAAATSSQPYSDGLHDNSALGGAIYADGGIINLADVEFCNNYASGNNSSCYGGAIYLVNGATLTYTVTENKTISNTGNLSKYLTISYKENGGFLYMGSAADKATFDILANANLTIGDILDGDSIAGVSGATITKSGSGYMLINSDISGFVGKLVISGGTLELGRIARTIKLDNYTIGLGAMLKLSSLNDTVNMNTDKNIGILDLGGGSDVVNTNGYALSGGELRISTLSLTGGGRISSSIVTRVTNAGFNLTLAGVQLESSITGGNAIDVINITQASTVNGVINLGGGNDTITATAAVTFGNTINLGDGNNTLTASGTAQFQKGLTGGSGDDRISLNGQTTFVGTLDLNGGNNVVTVNNTITAPINIKVADSGSTSIIVNRGASLTSNSLTVYNNPLATLTTVTLDWSNIVGLDKVRILISKDNDFSTYEFGVELYNQSKNFSIYTEASNFIQFQAQDEDGWKQRLLSDTIAPNQVTGLRIDGVSGQSVGSWDITHDDIAGNGVKQYNIQVSDTSTFSNIIGSYTVMDTSYKFSEISDGSYYCRVQAEDYTGNKGDWTIGSSFIVDSSAPSVPATLTQNVTGNNVAFDWADAIDSASGVKQYEVQVDNTSNFSSPEYSATPTASTATTNNLADGAYFWRVRTQDNSGNYSAWTTGSNFTVDTTAPTAYGPFTSTVTGNNVALDWTDATDNLSGVKQYEFRIDNNSDFLSNEKSGTVVTSNATATDLADGIYYWGVRAQDNFGNYSTWSGSSFAVDVTAPTVPATLSSTVTGNNVALDWVDATDNLTGVKQYEFQIDNNSDFSSKEKSGTAAASNANATGLADGNYYWRVRTQDYYGNYSAWTTASNFTVDIAAPAPATLTRTVTGNGVVFDWADAIDSASGVKQYDVQVDNTSNFSSPEYSATPTASTATTNNLADGVYYWKVRSQDNAGNYSAWTFGSNFTVDITAPSVPATLTRTVTGNNIALDWADATDATSGVKQYEFQIDNNSDFSSNEKSGTAAASNANATGLADGNYYWRVRTQDYYGNYSAWSSGSNFMVDINAPAPATLSSTVTGSSVALDWADATDATSGVKQYEFQIDNNSDFSSKEKSGTAVSSNANATGLADGNYYWRVRTQDNSGNYSAWSSGSNFMVDINAPAPATLSSTVTGSSVALDWADATDATSGVKQYEVQIDNNVNFSSPEYSTSIPASATTVNSLVDDIYYWKVRTLDNAGNYSIWTTGSNFTVDTTAPAVPSTLTRTVTGNNVAFDWADATDATSGVKNYLFQYAVNAQFSGATQSIVTVSNADVSNLSDGTFYWRVQAIDNSGNYSAWTTGSNFMVDVVAPTVPATLTRTVTGNSVVLDWADATDATSGVKQYEYQLDNNSDFLSNEKAGTAVTSDATVSSLSDGSYYWRVRTHDNFGNYSAWTSGSSFTVDVTAPTVPATLTRTVTGSNVALDWADAVDATSGVKQYEFQVDNNSDFSSNEKSGTAAASNTTATGLADGSYYWRVRTHDNFGNYSAWTSGSSFTVDVTAPTVPATLTRTVTGNSVVLDWADATDATSGVKQYEFQIDNNSDFSSNEKSGTAAASNANATGLADGNYYWRVRTQDYYGNYSPWSSGSNFMVDINAPSVPANLIPVVTGNNVAFDWSDSTDAPSGVKQYQIQLDKHADFSSPEYYATSTDNTANFNGLTDGTYYWRVNTQDNAGNTSAWSNGTSFVSDVGGTISGALLLSSPSTTGRVGTGDAADYYKITMTNAGMLTFGLTGLTGNADLTLLDAKGTMLKSSAKTGTADEAIAGVPLQAGTYYVKVAPGFGVKDASYTLTHAEKYCPADTAANTWQTAKNIDDGVDNWVGFGDSADFYKLTMTNAGTLSLGLNGLSGNADLSLLSSTGTTLKTSAKTGPADEAINNVLLLAGTYYVKVAPGTGVNDAAYTLTHTEKYCPVDKAANDYKTALDISNLDNWVGFGDTADFYKLTMINAGMLTLGLTGLTGNADLTLLNAGGMQLKTSSNTGITSEAITNVALLAGTYYVKVATGYGVNDVGYTLTHTEKYTPADTGANTWQTAKQIDDGVDNWVGFGDAADFYKLTMTNAGMLSLGLTGLTGNADLTLLNVSGMQLKASSSTGTTPEAINNVALLAGTYYVKVAAGFGVNDASYTLAHTEKYSPADKAANDYKTAQDISTLDNWVGFGDTADFYKLTMTNAGTLTLGLTGLTGNADLTLLNASGMQLKASSSTGTTPEAINNVALLAGTYYVKVAAGTSVNDASYTLAHTEKYCPADKAANDYKTALDISTLDNWVGFGDTADFYKLTMTNAGTLTLGLTGLTGNADLALLNSAGTALKTSANAGTANEAINNVSLLAGTYYVKVATGYGVNDASYNLINTVSYFPGDTSDKAGNTPAAAKLVDSPAQTGWVGFGDSDDYYKFDLAAAAQGTLRLYDMTGGNADLTLYDAKGAQLQKSAKTGALEDTITRNLAAGTYYARVNAVSGNIDYKLDFSKKDGYGMLAS